MTSAMSAVFSLLVLLRRWCCRGPSWNSLAQQAPPSEPRRRSMSFRNGSRLSGSKFSGMGIHPGNRAVAVFDRAFCFTARFADHRLAHQPIVHLGIAGPQLLAGGIGFIEAAFIDEADDTVREPVEIGLGRVVSMWRYRWRRRHMCGAVAMPAAALVLPAAATRAGLVSADFRHYRIFIDNARISSNSELNSQRQAVLENGDCMTARCRSTWRLRGPHATRRRCGRFPAVGLIQ